MSSIFDSIFQDFGKAINRLEEVLNLPKNDVNRDSAIKRFEICFDLAWKSIKNYARVQGLECYSPRECLKIAFQLKLVDHQPDWLTIIDDRNLTVHLYSEKYAEEVYSRLNQHLKLFQELLFKLENEAKHE